MTKQKCWFKMGRRTWIKDNHRDSVKINIEYPGYIARNKNKKIIGKGKQEFDVYQKARKYMKEHDKC